MEYDNIINQFFKKYNIDIRINSLTKKLFFNNIQNKNIINAIKNNKKIKRIIKNIIFNTENKKYLFNSQINLENNKYIFMLISLILSSIIYEDINLFDNNSLNNNKFLNYIIMLNIKMFNNNFISFHYIILFFHLYFDLIDKYCTNLVKKIDKIIQIASLFKKVIKIVGKIKINMDEKFKKSINKDIYEILRKIFIMNYNDNIKMKNYKFLCYIRKQKKIFELIKFVYDYYDINIISDENKKFIKTNLINLYINNFSNEHFNYLYNIFNKFIIKFNNKNTLKGSYNNNINLISGINEFFLEIYKNEKEKLQNNENYFDKFFIFDIDEDNNGIRVGPIKFDNSYNGITIIFSFYAIKYNYKYKKPQVLLSFRNEYNDKYLFKLLLIDNKLVLQTKKNNEESKLILMENIIYNTYNICILHYDKRINFVYLYLNKHSNAHKLDLVIKKDSWIYMELGYTNDGDTNIEIFNGMIGPILIFNSNMEDKFKLEIFQNILLNLKGKYYLLGEFIDNNNNKNIDKDNNYIFFNQIYYNTIDSKQIINIQKYLGKLLLYLNPEVILNRIGYEKKYKFRDYQYYFEYKNNSQNIIENSIYYYSNNIDTISYSLKKENNIIYSFMTYRGYDLIIFTIEYIYNYLLILYNNYNNCNNANFGIM